MKEFFSNGWMMIAGFFSSISAKSISTIANTDIQPTLKEVEDVFVHHDPMWHYLVIGAFGAIGGLLIKITWALAKRRFPKLNTLDGETKA